MSLSLSFSFTISLVLLFGSISTDQAVILSLRNVSTDVSEAEIKPKVNYHMGPVFSPHIIVHIIWYGNWLPIEKRIIREFINSVSAPDLHSPSVSDWWKTVHQYTDQTDSNVSRTVSLGKEKNDRLLSQGRTLTRLTVQSVIRSAINAKTNPLPVHPGNGLYLVLTADDIVVQDFCSLACGFHYFTFPSIVGYTLPFAWVGNSRKMCPDLCAFPFAVSSFMHGVKPLKAPNGDAGVDAMVSVIAHEIAELATNPLINAWYGGNDPTFPLEVADICEGVYGFGGGTSGYIGAVLSDKNGAVYNMYGTRRRFLVQWVWNHLTERCSGPNGQDA